MTVAVWDGKTLAVDSRATIGGDVYSDNVNKLFEVDHPELGPMKFACAGAIDLIGPWTEAISKVGFVTLSITAADDDLSLDGIFVDSSGEAYIAHTNGMWRKLDKGFTIAIGSGTLLANYLLRKNKKAVDVVREVCSTNVFCGGPVRAWDWKRKEIAVS